MIKVQFNFFNWKLYMFGVICLLSINHQHGFSTKFNQKPNNLAILGTLLNRKHGAEVSIFRETP